MEGMRGGGRGGKEEGGEELVEGDIVPEVMRWTG